MEFVFLFFCVVFCRSLFVHLTSSGADPGFQVRGVHLKKLRRAEGDAKKFEVFRVKNHDFTPINHIFSNFRGGARAGCAPPKSAPGNCLTRIVCSKKINVINIIKVD